MSTSKEIRKEIKEYSHLLRALKTSSAADLAAHIHPVRLAQDELSSGSKISMEPNRKEFWTKWPLLLNEVYPPAIDFEEEFVFLAEQTLSDNFPSDDDSSDHLSASDAPALAGSTLYALGCTLSLLSDSFPHVERGVQHRVKAADWKVVLELLANSHIFPDELVSICTVISVSDLTNRVLEIVTRRLTGLYESSAVTATRKLTSPRLLQ
jgi:hypothetical protein